MLDALTLTRLRAARSADVVVVDDDDDWLLLTSQYLTHAGCAVRSFSSASEALLAITAQVPEVIVTDLAMAPLDGIELARRVRASALTHAVPLIAMTGEVEPDWDVTRWFDAYLRKPVDLSLALHLVRQLAQQRRGEVDVARKRGNLP